MSVAAISASSGGCPVRVRAGPGDPRGAAAWNNQRIATFGDMLAPPDPLVKENPARPAMAAPWTLLLAFHLAARDNRPAWVSVRVFGGLHAALARRGET